MLRKCQSKEIDVLCKENNIEHRLTQTYTPKTKGMVERAKGIVKSNTILKEQYASNKDMEVALMKFLFVELIFDFTCSF